MKFSVIIPLFNGAGTIEKTLDSVISQTCRDYEVVLVNDESPDNVGEVVKGYINRHPDVSFTYIEQKNRGLGGARNTGIRNASGEICSFIDQDDIWYPAKLETVSKIFDEHDYLSVVFHGAFVRKNGVIVDCVGISSKQSPLHRDMLFNGNHLVVSATSVKRDAIIDVGFFSEDVANLHFAEDYDLWMNLALNDHCFYCANDYLTEYIEHEKNHSSGDIEKLEFIFKSGLFVINRHYSIRKIRSLFDWYFIRKSKANLMMEFAYRIFQHKCGAKKAVLYVLRAIATDPAIILRVPLKILKVLRRQHLLKSLRKKCLQSRN